MIDKIKNVCKSITATYTKTKKYLHKKYPSIKRRIFGMKVSEGLLYKIIMYFLLLVTGFVFIYPIIYMFSVSLMSNVDLVDNTIQWIPSKINISNYTTTYRALKLPKSLVTTIFIAGLSTISVATASALIGYGLARYQFKGKTAIFLIMIFTFIMPKTLFFIPTYQIFTALKIKGNLLALILPAISGQGLQAAFFILIFYQFFHMMPKAMEEAAVIDGANAFTIFYKIAIPMATPAFIITFVYAFSLYWNETLFISTYLDGKFKTIPMLLGNLESEYGGVVFQAGGDASRQPDLSFTESKVFAGTLISITPLIIMYAIVQRWFVESIDKSGITGE